MTWLRRIASRHAPEWLHRRTLHPAPSDGTLEAAGVDVVHFTHQAACLTTVPSIYNPHDLQHAHLPEYFTVRERLARERIWPVYARQAACVGVTSSYVRDDVIGIWRIPPARVRVIPWAPVITHYPNVDSSFVEQTRRELGLPESFALYPAQTWPHKNHVGLARAVALLRDQAGLTISVVCTGGQTRHMSAVLREIEALGVGNLFSFKGHLPPRQLRAVFQASRVVVVPTLYEAASFPVWEAFEVGVPVACAATTSLPAQAGDAALLFDPRRPNDIAVALQRLWLDESLRAGLVRLARKRVAAFTWERTAKTYRAVYRQVGRRPLSPEDWALLERAPAL